MVLIGCLLASACSSGQVGKPEADPIVETTEVEKTADAGMAENIDESNSAGQAEPESEEGTTSTMGYDFGEFSNVNITGIDLASLSDEELAVFKRGRNAKTGHNPKSATQGEYHIATGVEALFGYLYLSEQTERIRELFEIITEG